MTVRTVVTASGRVDVSGTGYAPEGELLTRDGRPLDEGRRCAPRSSVRCAPLSWRTTRPSATTIAAGACRVIPPRGP